MRRIEMGGQTPLVVTSPAFSHGGSIPRPYTGCGEDISPPLHLSGLHPGAVSLAVILDDLDIPLLPVYPHWLIWNLPPAADIPASLPCGARLPNGAVQGTAYGRNRYRGPKPPAFLRRPHRYRFRVYALDSRLDLAPASGRRALLRAMEGHILQWGELVGTYVRPRR